MQKFTKWLGILIFSFSINVYADIPSWSIVPSQSSLKFTATQNNAPVSGIFKKFSADIHFDPDNLAQNTVKIMVDMNSISTSYSDLNDTLNSSDWFNVKAFPSATFEAKKFTKTGDKTYQAIGTLTIRDKSQPITLNFKELKNDGKQAQISGDTIVKRSSFGVGQGEWASTDEVKDEVKIEFMVTANKKAS